MADGMKYDEGKADWTLLPLFGLRGVVRALEFGAEKYAPHSWSTVPDCKHRYSAAVLRHLEELTLDVAHLGDWDRALCQSRDSESGLLTLDHLLCDLLFVRAKMILDEQQASLENGASDSPTPT